MVYIFYFLCMELLNNRVFNIIFGSASFVLFFYIVFQIVKFLEIPTAYVFEYMIFYSCLLLFFIVLPRTNVVSWC